MALSLAEIAALSTLLDQALALPAEQRRAWLEGLFTEQHPHAERLRRMLGAAANAHGDERRWSAARLLGGLD